MSHVASSAPEPPNLAVIRQADAERSFAQVRQLLEIATHSGAYLVRPDNFEARIEIDPEARRIALQTFELAHIRIRDVVDQQVRWSMDPTEMDRESTKAITSARNLADARAEMVTRNNRPSAFLGANLRRTETGWVAFAGSSPGSHTVTGYGESPEEAFAAFDRAYSEKADKSEATPAEPVEAPRATLVTLEDLIKQIADETPKPKRRKKGNT